MNTQSLFRSMDDQVKDMLKKKQITTVGPMWKGYEDGVIDFQQTVDLIVAKYPQEVRALYSNYKYRLAKCSLVFLKGFYDLQEELGTRYTQWWEILEDLEVAVTHAEELFGITE